MHQRKKEMWVCGTVMIGADFVTAEKSVADKWINENQWHFARLVPVQSNDQAQRLAENNPKV